MSENEIKKGGISVETEHIFPVIKKWLYSDKDIFIREIVSNASDAVTKLKRLASLGEISLQEGEQFRIDVELDKDAKTLTVTDNGIGMTEEELQKYICSIALSGALDFIQKYEGKNGEGDNAGNGIIGHFGLGFYSSFMVSDCVEIDTLSYQGGAAVHWKCTEAGEYEVSSSDRTTRGTSVIMHISDDENEYLKMYKLKEILEKYCSFIPVNVYLKDVSAEPEGLQKDYDAGLDDDVTNLSKLEGDDENDIPSNVEIKKKEEEPINDTVPLWNKPQSEITPEEYNKFYHKLFQDQDDPLFYIHINADYPLNFKGILYFPKIRSESQSLEGQVKLFYNQVFVSDNIKEVLPDYLLMLRGALDCPELPLNVSRSYLQDNAYVKRIGQFIAKKVADKFNSLCTTDREKYEKVYSDIRIFIEFACIRDKKFFDRVKDSLILRLTDGKFKTINEYLNDAEKKGETAADEAENAEVKTESEATENTSENATEEKKEDPKGTVYYTSDTALQTQYIKMLEDAGCEVAIFDIPLDAQYITSFEQYREGVKFVRVDSDLSDALKGDGEVKEVSEKVIDLFKKAAGNDKLTVKGEVLKSKSVPAVLTVSENTRRFEDMMKLYVAPGEQVPNLPMDYTLTLNTSSDIYAKLNDLAEGADSERALTYASFVYRLALIAQKKLTAEELSSFLDEGYKVLGLI